MTDPLAEFRLDGEVAVVTGAASGIGRVVAEALAAVGARVASFDVAASGPDAYKVDVTDETQVKAAFAEVVARHGRVDVLFNNAGIAIRQPTTELTLENWNKVVAVNLTGVFLCAREAARHMLAGGRGGRIVNTASIMGVVGGGLYPNISYQATKGAVVNMTRALAVEWAASGHPGERDRADLGADPAHPRDHGEPGPRRPHRGDDAHGPAGRAARDRRRRPLPGLARLRDGHRARPGRRRRLPRPVAARSTDMKWCRYQSGRTVAYGLIEDTTVTEITGSPFDGYTRTSNTVGLSRVKLLVPVIPPTFYAAGVNYREHVTEMAQRRGVKPEFPPNADVGYRANNALVATDEPIVIPRDATDQVQYEGELVVVIGKRCKRVSEAEALDCVFGYTIGNDVSERTWQRGDRTFWRGKNTDTLQADGPLDRHRPRPRRAEGHDSPQRQGDVHLRRQATRSSACASSSAG